MGENDEDKPKTKTPRSCISDNIQNTLTTTTPRTVVVESPRSVIDSHRRLNDIPNNRNINDLISINENKQEQEQEQEQEQSLHEPSRLEIFFDNFMPKVKKMYIFCLLNVACILLISITGLLLFDSSNNHFPYIKAFQSNFYNSKLITDLYVVSTFEFCDFPYEKPSFGIWPGYNESCYCGNEKTGHPGICNQNEASTCQNIGPFDNISIKKWSDEVFCIRRSMKKLIEYFNHLSFSKKGGEFGCTVPKKKPCIISSNGNFICVDLFEFCPLTQIFIKDYQKDADFINITEWTTKEDMKNSKVLVGKSGDTRATAILNFTVQYANCTRTNYFQPSVNIVELNCLNEMRIEEIDREEEYVIVSQNSNNTNSSSLDSLKLISSPMGLYSEKADFLDRCVFDEDLNPKRIDEILNIWVTIEHYLCYNIIIILALLFLNVARGIIIMYLNVQNYEEASVRKRIKELLLYTRIIVKNSYVFIIFEIVASIFLITWTINILRSTQVILQKLNAKSCEGAEIFSEINIMIDSIKIFDLFNIITMTIFALLAIPEFILRKRIIYKELPGSDKNLQRL